MECCTNRKIENLKIRIELSGTDKIQPKQDKFSDYLKEWLYRKTIFVQSAKRRKFAKKGRVYNEGVTE